MRRTLLCLTCLSWIPTDRLHLRADARDHVLANLASHDTVRVVDLDARFAGIIARSWGRVAS